jgi:hypothetical protein
MALPSKRRLCQGVEWHFFEIICDWPVQSWVECLSGSVESKDVRQRRTTDALRLKMRKFRGIDAPGSRRTTAVDVNRTQKRYHFRGQCARPVAAKMAPRLAATDTVDSVRLMICPKLQSERDVRDLERFADDIAAGAHIWFRVPQASTLGVTRPEDRATRRRDPSADSGPRPETGCRTASRFCLFSEPGARR